MRKQICCFVIAVACMMVVSGSAAAQKSRKSVPATEVTGTFAHSFGGRFKGTASEIKIASTGKGKLRVAFDLVYPFIDGEGELTANTGEADGDATIKGDTAVYHSTEFGKCTITIKFVKPGAIKVTQEQEGASDCGFGNNVSADGTHKKISSKRPKF
jgi:hypothetical protein